MAQDVRPATAVLVGGITGLLVADVVLVAKGYAPETEALRTPAGKAFCIALLGHVLDVWGPLDPFRVVAGTASLVDRITPKFPGAHIP